MLFRSGAALVAIRDAYGDERRTEINRDHINLATEDLIEPQDVVVEMLMVHQAKKDKLGQALSYRFLPRGDVNEAGEHVFGLEMTPELCGKLEYRIRVYPLHENLTHPLELGLMRWL